jgi:2-iminoacetate synthase
MNTHTCDVTSWVEERLRSQEFAHYDDLSRDFINEREIARALDACQNPAPARIREILAKSLAIETLSLVEAACLLNVRDPGMLEEMAAVAAQVKKKVYDSRIVTFAPLYANNQCVNSCLYCAFRKDNAAVRRKALSTDEVAREIEVLAGKIGHKRLIAVFGEHPLSGIDYVISVLRAIYAVKVKTKNGWGAIRRVNVNAPPFASSELAQLRNAGIGTYQVFQETYHHDTYARVHPAHTIKSHYRWRLYCMHRALEAGVDDVGIGALFGLYDWKFEVLGLLSHALELERVFGIGPHTISFPRIEPAVNTPFVQDLRYRVGDEDFKKLVIVLRLAVPYAGMILTARETPEVRREVLRLGCTQTDASTKIGVGAYGRQHCAQEEEKQQFILGDTRSLDEVIRELASYGYITSFCTAGYRCGRTGGCIMELLRSGKEAQFCKLNAVLTFREWLDDFASPRPLP